MKNQVTKISLGAVLGVALVFSGAVAPQASAQAAAQPPAQPPAQQPQANPPAQAVPQNVSAQPSRVGIVQIQRAIAECAEGKKSADDLNKRFAPKQEELQRKQAEVQALQKKLQDGEKLLTDEQKAQLARDIDRKGKDLQRDSEDAQADYQQAMDGVINGIGGKMLQVIGVYAQRNGYDLIINSANQGEVLYATAQIDITEQIVGAYNVSFGTGSGLSNPPPAGTPAGKPAATPVKPATPPVRKP